MKWLDTSKKKTQCPYCQLYLIQDYWDIVEEQANGDLVVDVFEAWVCPDRCGYYIKIK